MNLFTKLLSLRQMEYIIINQDLTVLEISSGICYFLETSHQMILGQDIRIGFPELIGIEEVFTEIITEENNFELKGISRYLDDSLVYVDMIVTKNIRDDNSANQLMIIVENVTERMNMEQSLVQSANESNLLLRTLTASKQYIDQIIVSMADALLVTTSSGKIKTINPAAQALLEYEKEELIGKSISSVIKGVDTEKLAYLSTGDVSSLATCGVLSSSTKELETLCQTKSGKTIPIAFSYSTLQTDVQHFQGYVYILRDMTERKQAELAKQEFLAMINHEIRTPITSVTGMASLLLHTNLTTQQREFVETIYTSSDSLTTIINDILNFSKIESGQLELEEQPFHLQTCITQAINLLTPQAQEKGLQLSCTNNSALNCISGDITRLRQILVNLLNNAIKFTETGSVEVSVEARSLGYNHTHEIQFAVRDTGIGIPSDRLNRLFKAFSQVNSSITRQYGGTGLGLAICKQLSELMGGRIWVESQPGVGSTFYFTIKASVVKEGYLPDKVQLDTQLAEKYPLKILLVEDHVINQKMIGMMLERMGYHPDIANNGLEALSALRHQPYDLVLMDMQMPEMDGLTAIRHIREEFTSHPRIIALTASAMVKDEQIQEFGIDDYLAKPLRIEELIRVLQSFDMNGKQTAVSTTINAVALQEIFSLAEYNTSVNATQFLLETIDCYFEEAPRLLEDMQSYLYNNNVKALRRAVHTLSSISATLGAVNLAALCTELEEMIASGIITGVAELIEEIKAEYQLVEVALHDERQKYCM
jgi:PAS domain S-box-containing protein